ncbi:hypothetical protein FWG76_00575, partial [Candidatus Saccharibacteria bacterium]|nr:hypothetical protein [Candidatus Saccharibacteria bacterium]
NHLSATSSAVVVDRVDLPNSRVGKSWALVDGEWLHATPTPSADNKTVPEFTAVEEDDWEDGEPEEVEKSEVEQSSGVVPDALLPTGQGDESGVGGNGAGPVAKELADCGEGRYRNPLTNRCKKIEVPTEQKPCNEGYERNPETNRCRKIRENSGAALGFSVPDSGGTAGGTGASAAGGALASAGEALTDGLDRVFRDENGYLQGWKVVLTLLAVFLAAGIGLCYVFRDKLYKYRFFSVIASKIVAIRKKMSEKY